ncbi:MAG: alpha-mannosidase, partial [Ardenticatenaceae bacterium]
MSSSAAFYEWVEESDPAMFEEIKQRVAEGRWEIVGGWWIQPDCNIPGGESFVRQGLYGQHYFKVKFGVTATVGYNVDSFGHHGMLPQILLKSGLTSYVFLRPGPHEMGLPARIFWWESDDSSRVLAFRILYEYCTSGKELERHIQRCASELKAPFDEMMCFYGVGNHGGGPTRANIESIKRLADDPTYPHLLFSTPGRFFDAIRQKVGAPRVGAPLSLPVVHDELQHHASGCYVAHSGIKRWNREAENRLLVAEKFASVAFWETEQPYPKELADAWKGVLFNQFHDILAGTSLEAAYDDARNLYGEALAVADRGLNHAVQALSWKIHIEPEEGMKPIIVFNPHAWTSKMNVEVEVGGLTDNHRLVDDENRAIPMQRVQSLATARGRYRISFVAELPSLGYRTYRLLPEGCPGWARGVLVAGPRGARCGPEEHRGVIRPPSEVEPIQATDSMMENDYFRLGFDPETGYISEFFDKRLGINMLLGPAARPAVMADTSDTWSHNTFCFDEEIGAFEAASVNLVQHGPVKSVIRVTSRYNR